MASPYFGEIFSCSFNGAPFFARGAESNFGRKVAVHKYPYRDTVWPEDTGRKAREFMVEGFLQGDDVIAQRDWMKTVCETPGPGILIHPTYGILSVSLLNLKVVENWQHGCEIRLIFNFIESGQQLFPSIIISTFNAIGNATGNLNTAAANDFVSQATSSVALGASVVQKAVQTVTTFTALGGGLTKTATNIAGESSSLSGSFGRYAGGSTGSSTGSILGGGAALGGIASQLTSLINAGASSRTAVSAAGANANTVAGQM